MKETGKYKRYRNPQDEEPEYIIINEWSRVYTGLIGGEPNFSDDVAQAKIFRGQAIFDKLKRYSWCKIEQMFL